MFAKSLADIFVISLRIKTGSQRDHKQLILNLWKVLVPPIRAATEHLTRYHGIRCTIVALILILLSDLLAVGI